MPKASAIGIGVVEVDEIDRLNIYHAGLRAMHARVSLLPVLPQHMLVDSRTIPDLPQPQNSFDKGDGINFSIAAASIVAKVYRDRSDDGTGWRFSRLRICRAQRLCHALSSGRDPKPRPLLHPPPVVRLHPGALRGVFGGVLRPQSRRMRRIEAGNALADWEKRVKESSDSLSPMESKKLLLMATPFVEPRELSDLPIEQPCAVIGITAALEPGWKN